MYTCYICTNGMNGFKGLSDGQSWFISRSPSEPSGSGGVEVTPPAGDFIGRRGKWVIMDVNSARITRFSSGMQTVLTDSSPVVAGLSAKL